MQTGYSVVILTLYTGSAVYDYLTDQMANKSFPSKINVKLCIFQDYFPIIRKNIFIRNLMNIHLL